MSDTDTNNEEKEAMSIDLSIRMDDIWVDEGDVEGALKSRIIREAEKAIWDKIKENVEKTVNAKVIALVESKMDAQIYEEITSIIKEDKIKPRYGKEQSLREFVEGRFNESNTRGGKTVEKVVSDLAKNFGSEMKDRYDMLFASQLIVKLRDQGILKEEFAKSILD
ncbi:MAG: hypothetical protein ABJG33_04900 [Balneola sp.]